jgi:hypothetical protein
VENRYVVQLTRLFEDKKSETVPLKRLCPRNYLIGRSIIFLYFKCKIIVAWHLAKDRNLSAMRS